MITQYFSIRDRISGEYKEPFSSMNNEHAKRNILDFLHLPQAQESKINRYPGDHQLIHLFSFDNLTGHVEFKAPEIVCEISEIWQVFQASKSKNNPEVAHGTP